MEQAPITTNSDAPTSSNTKIQRNKKLIITLGLFGVIITVAIVYLFAVSSKKSSITSENKTSSEIKPKTEYKNPFDKSTQYVNPFDSYKNPFDQLK